MHLILSLLLAVISYQSPVTRWVDGDSPYVMPPAATKPVECRTTGDDAPEVAHNSKEIDQPYGQDAKAFAQNLTAGKVCTIRQHSKDKYGRPLVEVILPDGRSVAVEEIKAGMAWAPPPLYSTKAERANQAAAQQAKAGLWKDTNPIPPWTWRKTHPTEDKP